MFEVALSLVTLILGCGGAGIGLAWLNDRRHDAKAKRLPAQDPRTVLEMRFAAGEMDEAEFTRRMRLLVYGPPIELDH